MRTTPVVSLTAALLLLAGTASAADNPTWDGLEWREAKGIDALYVRPAVAFKPYENVFLDTPVEVAFDKDWDPNEGVRSPSRRLSAADIDAIRMQMADGFQAVFAEELAAGGYALVPAIGEKTLRVRAALADVYINAPERPGQGRETTYTVEPGRMTLVMELRDGPTGQLLARVIDTTSGTNSGAFLMTSSSTNQAELERAVRAWSRRLVAGLDQVKGRQ